MHTVFHQELCRLNLRMVVEIRPDDIGVPVPTILRICCGMYAYISLAGRQKRLHGQLLIRVQHVACRVQENDDIVGCKARLIEHGRILRGGDIEVVLRSKRLDGSNACGDGVMAKAGRLRKNQRAETMGCPSL